VGDPVNTGKHEDRGTLSDDGRLLIFERLVSVENQPLRSSILMATRADWGDPWSDPVPLFSVATGSDHAPRLLPDGKTLLFSSGRPGGDGWSDIWMATLVRKQKDEEAVSTPNTSKVVDD
jgi:Tol biopolymer transport system component